MRRTYDKAATKTAGSYINNNNNSYNNSSSNSSIEKKEDYEEK